MSLLPDVYLFIIVCLGVLSLLFTGSSSVYSGWPPVLQIFPNATKKIIRIHHYNVNHCVGYIFTLLLVWHICTSVLRPGDSDIQLGSGVCHFLVDSNIKG